MTGISFHLINFLGLKIISSTLNNKTSQYSKISWGCMHMVKSVNTSTVKYQILHEPEKTYPQGKKNNELNYSKEILLLISKVH